MVGLPLYLQTKQDWAHAIAYVRQHPSLKPDLLARLQRLQELRTIKVLKESVQKPSEELSPDDFEEEPDPGAYANRIGLTGEDIQQFLDEIGE